MRRPTLIALIVLLAALLLAGALQVRIAGRSHPQFQGPSSPGQLPSVATPSSSG